MFTTGKKQGIFNAGHGITIADGVMTVVGFGSFPMSAAKMPKFSMVPELAETVGVYTLPFTTANTATTEFVANDLLTVGLTFKSTRRDPEYKEDGEDEANTYILTIKPLAATAEGVATALRLALTNADYKAYEKYHINPAAFGATANVVITSDSSYYSLERVEINKSTGGSISDYLATITTPPVQPRGTAKFLEESVKSSGNDNKLYSVGSDIQINPNTTYAQVTLTFATGGGGEFNSHDAINGSGAGFAEAVLYIDSLHDFVTTWATVTTGTEDLIEAAAGRTFTTSPTPAQEITFMDAGGLLKY